MVEATLKERFNKGGVAHDVRCVDSAGQNSHLKRVARWVCREQCGEVDVEELRQSAGGGCGTKVRIRRCPRDEVDE